MKMHWPLRNRRSRKFGRRALSTQDLSVENGTLNAQMFSDPNLAYKLRGSHVSPLEERGAAP